MIERVLESQFKEHQPNNANEQENILQEILQKYVLASLARQGFFVTAIFHGGTCLRIIHDMQRFSEDLDFLLKKPSDSFDWDPFVEGVKRDCMQDGIEFQISDRRTLDQTVAKRFLKTESIGKLMYFNLPFNRHQHKKLRIKLEIDTNPPQGSEFETAYLSFPQIAPVTVQTLESGFALKLHALLCRNYVKGRDWYDFIWYCSRRIVPSTKLLGNALRQQGPWKGDGLTADRSWIIERLHARIGEIDWRLASEDVRRFVPTDEQEQFKHWSEDLFLYQLKRLDQMLKNPNRSVPPE